MVEEPEQIKKNHMILRVLSKLSKEMGIRTVVEGVERNEDVEFLKSIDCDIAQGYYYDRPIPVDAFDAKYMQDRPLSATSATEIKQLEESLIAQGVQIVTAAPKAAAQATAEAEAEAKKAEEDNKTPQA